MDRRAYLTSTVCSIGILAGCLDFGEDSSSRIQVKSSNLSITEFDCRKSDNHDATVSVSNGNLIVTGTFATTQDCTDLDLSVRVGLDKQSEGHLNIRLEELGESETDCSSCIREIDYRVTVETTEQPSQINVLHYPLEGRAKEPAVWTGKQNR